MGTLQGRRVVVTGGAGFIGSHLCDALVGVGAEVVCVDNLVGTSGSTRNIDHLQGHPLFSFVREDIVSWARHADLRRVDTVFHQAASKNVVCMTDPERDLVVNALGTLVLLRRAQESGVRKFIHASTGSVYGPPARRQDETHPRNPVSFYGVSKTAAESYCQVVSALSGFDITVLRYFHVIGPRQDDSDYGGVVAIFVRRCLEGRPLVVYGTGEQTRSFTSVHDIVRANLWAAEPGADSQGVFNCASGVRVTIKELAEFVIEETRADVPILYEAWRPGDIVSFDVDNSRLVRKGFSFDQCWQDAVREVIAWKRRQISSSQGNASL